MNPDLRCDLSPGDHKEHTADPGAGQQHVQPDVRGQRVKEGEDAGVGAVGFTIQDADPQSHEGFGEVDDFLSDVRDGQRSHGQICNLQKKKIVVKASCCKGKKKKKKISDPHVVDELSNHAVPLSLIILGSIFPINHQSDLVREAQDVGEFLQQVQAVALEPIVTHQLFVGFFIHHVRIFL